MPAVEMFHEEDPKELIWKKFSTSNDFTTVNDIEVFGNDILIAIYRRPEKTKSGILMPDKYRDEDIYQGKVGLVLKMGPTAFIDEKGYKFRNISVKDWVVFRPSDGWQVTLNTMKGNLSKDSCIDCRIIPDISIRMRVKHPDSIW